MSISARPLFFSTLLALAAGCNPGAAPAITTANVPPMAAVPAAGNAIAVGGSTINVPN